MSEDMTSPTHPEVQGYILDAETGYFQAVLTQAPMPNPIGVSPIDSSVTMEAGPEPDYRMGDYIYLRSLQSPLRSPE